MKALTVGLTATTLMLAVAASAQILYAQPYTPRQSAFESRIASCGTPRPFMRIALDDWKAAVNSPITKIEWWGNLVNIGQSGREFYFAIYKNNPATNKPVMPNPIWKMCMKSIAAPTNYIDCKGKMVFKLTAKFPLTTCFKQIAGERYWLQISEADKESFRLNVEDFRWSGRRPIVNFPAVQFTSTGGLIPTLVDVCDNLRDDLSFILYRS